MSRFPVFVADTLVGGSHFPLQWVDYLACVVFFVALSMIGYWAGRRERSTAQDYFLAGNRLPWYVIGGSFIASNISTEHFIGMVGAAVVYGICVGLSEWLNVFTFSLLIWIFVPFLLASHVFTIPEFLERRFSPAIRLIFAIVTIVSNVVAFLAAVLYGGALALHNLFGWELWWALIGLGIVAGIWAIYGGLSSVAWTDLFTVVVMVLGGFLVTVYGLQKLAGPDGTLVDGFTVMLQRNEASAGIWHEAVARNAQNLAATDTYNRLSVFQPAEPSDASLGQFAVDRFVGQCVVQRAQSVHDPTGAGCARQLSCSHGHCGCGIHEVDSPGDRRHPGPDPVRP